MVEQLHYQNDKRLTPSLVVVFKEEFKIQRLGALLFLSDSDGVGLDVGVKVVIDAAPGEVNGLKLLYDVVHDVLNPVDIQVQFGIQLVHYAYELGQLFYYLDVDDHFDVELPHQVAEELLLECHLLELLLDGEQEF